VSQDYSTAENLIGNKCIVIRSPSDLLVSWSYGLRLRRNFLCFALL